MKLLHVEDSLPNYGEEVLTVDDHGSFRVGARESTNADGEWWALDGVTDTVTNVEYWGKLPRNPV